MFAGRGDSPGGVDDDAVTRAHKMRQVFEGASPHLPHTSIYNESILHRLGLQGQNAPPSVYDLISAVPSGRSSPPPQALSPPNALQLPEDEDTQEVHARVTTAFCVSRDTPPLGLVLHLINSATSDLVLAMYKLHHKDVVEALCRAVARGVPLRCYLDGKENKPSGSPHELVAAGANVRFSTRKLHAKFLVVDKSVLLTGSLNYTKKGLAGENIEGFMVVRDPVVAGQAVQAFDELARADTQGAAQPAQPPPPMNRDL